MKLPTAIFREYDIRGTVGDQLTAEVGRAIGQAVATLGWERLGRAPRLAVGRDNRPSGPALTHGRPPPGCRRSGRAWAATAWRWASCRSRRSTSRPTCSTWTAAS